VGQNRSESIEYDADDGPHRLTVADRAGGFELTEPRGLQVFAPCTQPVAGDSSQALCPYPTAADSRLELQFGAGSDALAISSSKGAQAAGGAGSDDLAGGPGLDRLSGGEGNDQVAGGGGPDGLGGGAGDDVLKSRDGEVDGIDCGDGADTALVDYLDELDPGTCETVQPGDTEPRARYRVTVARRVATPKKDTGFGPRYVMQVRIGCPRAARRGCAGQFKLCRDARCQDKIRVYPFRARRGRTYVVRQRLESSLASYAQQIAHRRHPSMWGAAVLRDSAGHTRSTFTKLRLG
jgi:hypothetical protein